MVSRISIKADFYRNSPYIEVAYSPSEDARDGMVQAFTEKLEHHSRWCIVEWQTVENNGSKLLRLYPITPAELPRQKEQMEENIQNYKDQYPQK